VGIQVGSIRDVKQGIPETRRGLGAVRETNAAIRLVALDITIHPS
jgi:hypothetical protein